MNVSQLNISCGENAVYVYDGLPELVDITSQSALSAVFCTEEALPTAIVESRTGKICAKMSIFSLQNVEHSHFNLIKVIYVREIFSNVQGTLTVHYKQGLSGESFSALYKVKSCDNCPFPRECRNGQCVCMDGLVGYDCGQVICPNNCTHDLGHGTCDKSYGRCLCTDDWVGPSCNVK